MSEQLSHTDPDLQLAQQIGNHRDDKKPLSNIDHPLVDQLLGYREQNIAEITIDQNDKQAVWERVVSKTATSSQKTPVTPLFNNSVIRWAAAAIILIAGIFGVVYWQSLQPQLIASSANSIEMVELSDGSTVQLRPHSQLFAIEKSSSNHQYKIEGEGLFEVTDNPNRTFSVSSTEGKVTVLGTRFTVSSWNRQLQVYLAEGSIRIDDRNQHQSVTLNPGESASVSESDISVSQTANADEFLDWLDQQIIFENKTARFVARELEQQFNISVTLPANVADNTLSGRLSTTQLETALTDLEIVLDGTFRKTGNRSYTFEAQ